MEAFLERLEQTGNWKEIMRSACKRNNLCTSLAGELTPGKLKLLKERFRKAYLTNPDSISECWIQHQMKAFTWALIALSALKNTTIDLFALQDWKTLYQLFQKKSSAFLRYQTRRFLLQKNAKNKNWAPDQNQMLCSILSMYEREKIPWNEAARQLFQQSQQKYFRIAKHCRQHWFNYLDPSKQRGDWTNQQDINLLEEVQMTGKKWAKLGTLFNRTENSVKNRFNSIITKQKKVTPNIRKQSKLIEAAKKTFQSTSAQEKEEKEEPKIRIKLKMSSESMFGADRSYNNEPFMTFHQVQSKNRLDFLQNYTLQGGQFVKHLLKDDDEVANKAQMTIYPSFWTNSPKNITPMGFSPSPFTLNYNYNYYIHNFNVELQKQNEKEESNPTTQSNQINQNNPNNPNNPNNQNNQS